MADENYNKPHPGGSLEKIDHVQLKMERLEKKVDKLLKDLEGVLEEVKKRDGR